jgi:hypothetical protein
LRANHETPHHVLPGESSNNCHPFTGISEKKVGKTLDFTGIAPTKGQAMTVWSDDLHKELEQDILK